MQRQVWHRTAVGEAPSLEVRGAPIGQTPTELVQQPRLADARLAHDSDQLSASGLGLAQHVLQNCELSRPAHERAQGSLVAASQRRTARSEANDPERRDGLDLALDRQRGWSLDANVALHEPARRLAHQNGSGLGVLLEPGGEIRGVADRCVVHPEVVADLAYHHRAGVEPHTHRDAGSLATRGSGLLAYGPLDAERGQDGAACMVLVGHRCAEQSHEAVAEELVDRALVAMDFGESEVEEPVQERVHGLGAEALDQGRRVDDVAEENGDDLPLTLERAARREDLRREVLGRVRRW